MSVKLIAEIGINHKGSFDIAKNLIDLAEKANCWGIKFQYRNIKNFYSSTLEIGDELIYEELKRSDLNLKTIKKLKEYAQSKSLKVGISFFTISDYKEIINFDDGFDFFKIPSAEFSNIHLIKEVSKSKKEILLSTGGHNLKDIKRNIKSYDFLKNAVILHCTSNYPTETGDQNLDVIKELTKIKNIKVGYSSHDKEYEIIFLAAAYGAKYIERHITLDKFGDGLDDSSSSTFEEFQSMSKILNNLELIVGNKNKAVNQGEIINLQNLGTSIYANKNLAKGKLLTTNDFLIKAPRLGITLNEFTKQKNKRLTNGVSKGEPINSYHFKKRLIVSQKDIDFVNNNKISIPIRFHDMREIYKEMPIKNYEFHLSYQDLNEFKNKSIINSIDRNAIYTFHLPDYLDKNSVFNPFSTNKAIKKKSEEILEKTALFISTFNQKDSLLVSSISQNSLENKNTFYYQLSNYINEIYKTYNIKFLPQWLPKKAWYFGGSFDTQVLSSSEDIYHINKYKIKICLDVAHLIMSANFHGEDWYSWFKSLQENTDHIHLSDAYGTNGEGVEFGKGELTHIGMILNINKLKVLEVWQGHLNSFSGFKEAIKYLEKGHY
tara:strand:- start:2745 stop:4556 length:1812 start_codon:yes stop_codon:yes gene_type:complete